MWSLRLGHLKVLAWEGAAPCASPSPLVAGLFSPGPWVCFVFVFPFFFLVRGMARFKVELESVGNHVGSRRLFATLEFFTQVAAGVLERVLPVLSDFNPPSQIFLSQF